MKITKTILSILASLLFYNFCVAQTVGLLQHQASTLDNGYILFAPISSTTTYLIDACGKQVHTWNSNFKPGQAVYLLEDGTLLRSGNKNNSTFNAGGKGGIIEKIDWNGNVLWSYTISDTNQCQHHDIKALPNGNVLVISWERKTKAQAIAAGRNPSLCPNYLWSEKIIELQASGVNGANIVWEWHLWDHLVQDYDNTKANYGVVAANPNKVNINFNNSATQSDWIHLNAIDYNATLNQILLSSHAFSEVWIIDHSTTTTEASSGAGGNTNHGGDLLYRWGNPSAYSNAAPQQFFGQHSAYWLNDAGEILVFNNGLNRTGGNYSSVDKIQTPLNGLLYNVSLPFLPATSTILYNANNVHNYYAQNISGAQVLDSKNLLLCNGPAGAFMTVDSNENTLWAYTSPVYNGGVLAQNTTPTQNQVFRAAYYDKNYAGFSGKTLLATTTIENTNTLSANCILEPSFVNSLSEEEIVVYPNPFTSTVHFNNEVEIQYYCLYSILGNKITEGTQPNNFNWENLKSGVYLLQLRSSRGTAVIKLEKQ